jgi:hypothetical protein
VIKSDEILIKTFDQVKNDNFDQVKFDQVIVCPSILPFDLVSLNKSQRKENNISVMFASWLF